MIPAHNTKKKNNPLHKAAVRPFLVVNVCSLQWILCHLRLTPGAFPGSPQLTSVHLCGTRPGCASLSCAHPPEREGQCPTNVPEFCSPPPAGGDLTAFPSRGYRSACTYRRIWHMTISLRRLSRTESFVGDLGDKVRIAGLLNAILSKYVPPSPLDRCVSSAMDILPRSKE